MDNPRTLLAIALSFLVLLIWQAWMEDYAPKPDQQARSANPETATAGTESGNGEDLPTAPADAAVSALPESQSASDNLASAQRVEIVTDLFKVIIDSRGGDIREVDLLQYPQTREKDSPPFRLMNDTGLPLFIAQSGLRVKDGPEPTHHALYQTEQTHYKIAEGQDTLEIPLHWTDENGVRVTKRYRFHRGSYVIDLDYEVSNQGTGEWTGRPYYQLQRTPLQQKSRFLYTYTGGVLYSPEEKYEKISFDDMQDENLNREVKGGWAAMIQHYFLAAWIPPEESAEHYYSRALSSERYVIGYIGAALKVGPGSEQTTRSRMFVGPKLQHVLKTVAPGLELTVDYGKLTFLAEPVYWLLDKIHSVVGNWGWSIIFVTLIIKLAFYKLSEHSYKSMANMRKLAPRLKSLKERYGDDKQRLNQAMMEMYKKEKINPLGGCLPVVVQIPVFISLYWVLLESVEMRQAPFMLWIQDLSSPDPYFILPLIMGVTMIIQQKLNPAPMDPIQAKVMMILPVVFTVFFAFFPAGLVLYWVVNNTLSITQQWVITKRVEKGTT